MEAKTGIKVVGDVIKKNNTTIMFITGACCTAAALFFTVKSTMKAKDLLEDDEEVITDEDGNETILKRSLVDTLKLIGKTYWLPGVLAATGLGLMTASHVIECANTASAAMAAGVAAQSLNEWKDTAKKAIGDKNYDKIEQAVAEKKVDEALQNIDDVPWIEPDMENSNGCVVIDSITGQKGWVTRERIDELNHKYSESINCGETVTLNDYLQDIHCRTTRMGDCLGWPAEFGLKPTLFLGTVIRDDKQYVYVDHQKFPMPL